MSATEAAEGRVERIAGAIYGTIVVAGVLAATSPDDDPEVVDTAVYALATIVVFWLAHAWAHSIAHRAAGTSHAARRLRQSLVQSWPLVQSAFPPIVVMMVATALGADDEAAILFATCSCVVLLAGWGYIAGRQEGHSLARALLTSAGCAALGLILVGLKVLFH